MNRLLARGVALLGAAAVVAGLALVPWGDLHPQPDHPASWIGQLLIAVSFGFVGLAVVEQARPPQTRVGWALLVPGFAQATTFATSSWLARSDSPGLAQWLDDWMWVPAVATILVVLPAVFPTGAGERGFPGLPQVATGAVALTTALVAYDAVPQRSDLAGATAVAAVATVAVGLIGIASLALRYVRGSREVREQVRWLIWMLVLLAAVEALTPLLPAAVDTVALPILPVLVPVSVGLAVLRHGLFDIDLLLSRTLTYLLVSGVLLAAYLGVVLVVARGLGDDATGAGALTILVVALVVSPLRDALQRMVQRRLWGPLADRQAALRSLTRQIADSPSLRDSPQIVVDELGVALRAPVALVAGTTQVAATGPLDSAVEAPVTYSGRQVGYLLVGRRPSGPLELRERRLLDDVAAAVGPVLDSLLLSDDLRLARRRAVEARRTERERVHRDLHDGLGPTLAGLTLGLDAARNLVGTDPEAATATLDRLAELAGAATAEVRRVVDGLRPRVLDDHGLGEAIRQEIVIDGVPPDIVVHDGSLPPLGRQTQTVALRVVLEAVTNVRRHADATTCQVGLSFRDGVLSVAVDDDGRGIEQRSNGSRPGVGLDSMRRRVEGLGGRLEVAESALGGTRVLAELPVRTEAE